MSKIISTLLDSSFHIDLDGNDCFEITPTIPDNYFNTFSICIAHDQDIHIMPSIDIESGSLRNERGEMNDIFMDMFFSYEQYPVFTGFIHILAHAIDNDNQGYIPNVQGIERDKLSEMMEDIIKSHHYPLIEQGKIYSRLQDDNGGDTSSTLDVEFTSQGAYIKVRSLDSLRFRTYYGGGKSHRVRNVLFLLCYLIKTHQL